MRTLPFFKKILIGSLQCPEGTINDFVPTGILFGTQLIKWVIIFFMNAFLGTSSVGK